MSLAIGESGNDEMGVTMTTRILGPWNNVGNVPTCYSNGVGYMGFAVDAAPSDVGTLTAAGWTTVSGGSAAQSGPTGSRPTTGLIAGQCFLDTTIKAVIAWDGAVWRDPVSVLAIGRSGGVKTSRRLKTLCPID